MDKQKQMTENEKRDRALKWAVDELTGLICAGYTAAVMVPRLARAYDLAPSRIKAEVDRRHAELTA